MPLHPDEEKMFAELKRELGDDAVKRPDQISGSDIKEANLLVLTMDAGNLEQASEMALAANLAIERNPKIKFMFAINGVGDDPREVDQIPEARATLRTLCSALRHAAFWRFEVDHQGIMLVASGQGYRTGTTLHVPPWMVRKPE